MRRKNEDHHYDRERVIREAQLYRLRIIEADAMVSIAKSRRITDTIDQLINPPGKGKQK